MADTVKLPENSRKVLRVLNDGGATRGFELQRRAFLQTPQELFEAVMPLISANLVVASGALDLESILRTQFAPLSSGRRVSAYEFGG